MENVVLTIGGLLKRISLSDLFFFGASLILILLLVYILYLIKTDEEGSKEKGILELPKMQPEKDAIENIVTNIEENYGPKHVDLSKYEQEMEDTAIISYDELLKRASSDIAYDDNYRAPSEDLVVKKVDDTNTSTTREYVDLKEAVMMSYESEEEFLNALKKIQDNLVR